MCSCVYLLHCINTFDSTKRKYLAPPPDGTGRKHTAIEWPRRGKESGVKAILVLSEQNSAKTLLKMLNSGICNII